MSRILDERIYEPKSTVICVYPLPRGVSFGSNSLQIEFNSLFLIPVDDLSKRFFGTIWKSTILWT